MKPFPNFSKFTSIWTQKNLYSTKKPFSNLSTTGNYHAFRTGIKFAKKNLFGISNSHKMSGFRCQICAGLGFWLRCQVSGTRPRGSRNRCKNNVSRILTPDKPYKNNGFLYSKTLRKQWFSHFEIQQPLV